MTFSRTLSWKNFIVAAVLLALLVPSALVLTADAAEKSSNVGSAAKTEGTKPVVEPDFGCFSTSAGGNSKAFFDGCGAYVAYKFMSLTIWIQTIAGTVLNWIVVETVLGMGILVGNLPGIVKSWEVLRDLANVFLVFITIFIGIATIVQVSSYGAKNMLFKVILAALFVNFSITLTKVVIDVSNLATLQLYVLILKGDPDNTNLTDETIKKCMKPFEGEVKKDDSCLNFGISGAFTHAAKMSSVFDIKNVKSTEQKDALTSMMYLGIAGGVLYIVMAFVFFAAAFMLLARFVILVMCIIVSPVAFVAWVTGISPRGKEWWKTVLSQSFFAPALFIMWWIALAISNNMKTLMQPPSITQLTSLDPWSSVVFFYFFIIMALFIASLIVAKEFGASGANAAMSMGKKWATKVATVPLNYTKKAAAGTARLARNQTYGRLMNVMGNRREAAMAKIHEKNDDGTYVKKDLLSKLSRLTTTVGLDSAIKRGIDSQAKGFRDGRQSIRDRKLGLGSELGRQKGVDAAKALQNTAGKTEEQISALKKTVQSMSQQDIEWIRQNNQGIFKHQSFGENLSATQLAGMMTSDKFLRDEKEKLRTDHYKEQIAILGKTGPLTEDEKLTMKRLHNADIELLKGELVKHAADATHDISEILSAEQFDVAFKNANYTDAQKETLRTSFFKKQIDAIKGGDERIIQNIRGKELDYLRTELLENKGALEKITGEQLDAMFRSSTYSAADRERARDGKFSFLDNLSEADNVKKLHALSDQEIAHISETHLNKPGVVENIKQSQVEKVLSSPHLSSTVKTQFAQKRTSHLSKNPGQINSMRSTEKGKLDESLLTQAGVAERLSASDLVEISKNHSSTTKDAIRGVIESKYNTIYDKQGGLRDLIATETTAAINRKGAPLTQAEEAAAIASAHRALTDPNEKKIVQAYEWMTNPIAGSIF